MVCWYRCVLDDFFFFLFCGLLSEINVMYVIIIIIIIIISIFLKHHQVITSHKLCLCSYDGMIMVYVDTCVTYQMIWIIQCWLDSSLVIDGDVCKLQLGASDRWYCPTCRRYQTGTIKSLSLSSLPDVMVVQLKRFKQVSSAVSITLQTSELAWTNYPAFVLGSIDVCLKGKVTF